MNKISVIGTGSVGSTIAYSIAIMGFAAEIVMIDINREKALGEALDIRQGTPFCTPCSIYAGDYPDAAGSNIVVLTSGLPRKPGQSRLELAQSNVNITKMIIPEITKYAPDATYVIVSNPVDILTYTFHKFSGLPENRIIGSGTILDTARLRSRLSEYYNISQNNIHAYVFGEHGDSSFIPWSVANISNVPIAECPKVFANNKIANPELDLKEIEDYVRKSGARVIARKGATFYAVSMSVCHICKCVLSGIDTTMTVSTMMHGEYGIDDVCLSTLNAVGHGGVRNKVNISLTDEETAKLRHSADTLKAVLKNLDI
ncbi:L-lactate dehydrogenase [Yeguia hominis]|uniref:L-lactate dehydrogenase n=1 Tax=Yeguia hominis TaxID=2763662 RepID=A0A926HRM5_9FIRM|nr:L-lactate dehydrogenase [Yeguia hominis]MBC8533929.1 L-lactate dehydrogenase [Yeguia hominis]